MGYRHKIYDYYEYFNNNYNLNDPCSVGWGNVHDQEVRFQKLLEIGVKSENSILDYGCGFGHLLQYMNNNDFKVSRYTGIDISYNHIKNARILYPNNDFFISEIYDVIDTHDYVLASGVFTIGMSIDEVYRLIDKSYEVCNLGVAFNMINSKYLDESYDYFNTFKPNIVFDLLKDKYGDVVLVDDYLIGEDFTIYIYKHERR